MSNPRLHELHVLLQKALELELFTIGPYLTALYSMREGRNPAATRILQSVVMEEMLHMTLVANVINAIGGSPCLSPDIVNANPVDGLRLEIRTYPSRVPHVDLHVSVSLARFRRDAIEVFRTIEEPEEPKTWKSSGRTSPFGTIGQFYDVLLDRLISVTTDLGEAAVFTGSPGHQITRDHYYGAGGNVTPVHSLADAKDVITEVAQQGEGRRKLSNQTGDRERFGQPKEVAHYFRFQQILAGRYYDRDDDVNLEPTGPDLVVDWDAVYPMRKNPAGSDTHPEGIAALLNGFDRTYRSVLRSLHEGFNGHPAKIREAVTAMQRLKQESIALMRIEIDGGETHGPPFWYVELKERQETSK
jgi:hypothetical protein